LKRLQSVADVDSSMVGASGFVPLSPFDRYVGDVADGTADDSKGHSKKSSTTGQTVSGYGGRGSLGVIAGVTLAAAAVIAVSGASSLHQCGVRLRGLVHRLRVFQTSCSAFRIVFWQQLAI
jgi:hypothetical protein